MPPALARFPAIADLPICRTKLSQLVHHFREVLWGQTKKLTTINAVPAKNGEPQRKLLRAWAKGQQQSTVVLCHDLGDGSDAVILL